MKHRLLVVCATVTVLMLHASPAHAGLWAWLEEFSGPGPFDGEEAPVYLTFCKLKQRQTRAADESWFKSPTLGPLSIGLPVKGETDWCLFYDEVQLQVDERRDSADSVLYPEIHVRTHEFGGSLPIAGGMFELGAGIGWITVESPTTIARRPTVTPLRLVSRPLFFISKLRNKDDRWRKLAGSFKVYMKETAVLGPTLNAIDDFGAPPTSALASFETPQGELLRSYGFVLDLTDFVFAVPWEKLNR